MRAAYTFAKSIDESSNTGGTIQYNFPSPQDSRNLRGGARPQRFRYRPLFAASFIWTPTFRATSCAGLADVRHQHHLHRPAVHAESGELQLHQRRRQPSRPHREGYAADPTFDQWFDRTAFPVVPLGSYRFGTSGRNILDGPGTSA